MLQGSLYHLDNHLLINCKGILYHSLCPIFSRSISIFLKNIMSNQFTDIYCTKQAEIIMLSFYLFDQINIIQTIKQLIFTTRYSSLSTEALKHAHHHKKKQSFIGINLIERYNKYSTSDWCLSMFKQPVAFI